MKLVHIRESDFKKVPVEYRDFHYELAKKINELVLKEYSTSPGVILTTEDAKKLIIGARDDDPTIPREARGCGIGMYRITIEPLEAQPKAQPTEETNSQSEE
jgi:hypothetical protein